MPTLADLTDWLKDKGVALADLVNAGATPQTRQMAQSGMSLSDMFHGIANPDAVLNSPAASVGSGFAPLGLAGIMTYHGTPHNVSAWDLSKVGTGQGAQSYGHGIYFAENPQTANAYKEMLGGEGIRYPSGETVSSKEVGPGAASQALNYVTYLSRAPGVDDPIAKAIENIKKMPSIMQEPEQSLKWLENWQASGAKFGQLGKTYKQDLPDEMLPRMLQWDKPLSEQPEAVFRAIDNDPLLRRNLPSANASVQDIVMSPQLNALLPVQQAGGMTNYLAGKGIPGLSYLDAGSRGAGTGTMNHVIWDQELLNRMAPQRVE